MFAVQWARTHRSISVVGGSGGTETCTSPGISNLRLTSASMTAMSSFRIQLWIVRRKCDEGQYLSSAIQEMACVVLHGYGRSTPAPLTTSMRSFVHGIEMIQQGGEE